MLKLVCKSVYVLFQVTSSGNEKLGIQVTEGRENKATNRPKKAVFYWFDVDDDAGLVSRAATLIRARLDKEFKRAEPQEIQLSLFGASSLFDEEEEAEHPLLTRAFDLALELPSTVQWKTVFLAAAMPCNLCAQTIGARAIAHTAMVKTPAGDIMHLQCPECKAAGHKPPEEAAPTLRVVVNNKAKTPKPATRTA